LQDSLWKYNWLIPRKNANIFKKLRDRWSTISSCTANLSNLELIPDFPWDCFRLLGKILLNVEGLEKFVQTLMQYDLGYVNFIFLYVIYSFIIIVFHFNFSFILLNTGSVLLLKNIMIDAKGVLFQDRWLFVFFLISLCFEWLGLLFNLRIFQGLIRFVDINWS